MADLFLPQKQFLIQHGYLPVESDVDDFEDAEFVTAVEHYRAMEVLVDSAPDGRDPVAHAMDCPRCGRPDAGPVVQQEIAEGQHLIEAARGRRGWWECRGHQGYHSATVRWNYRNFPSFLEGSLWKKILTEVVDSYAEHGLLWVMVDPDGRNILTGEVEQNVGNGNVSASFTRGNGWIGLAIVGNNSIQRCNSNIWARYEYQYRPRDLFNEWTNLIRHEQGHNCGFQHRRGGLMNPGIINGAPTRFTPNDPHYNDVRSGFGGVQVPTWPPDNEPDPEPPKPPTGTDSPGPLEPVGEPFRPKVPGREGERWQVFRILD